MAFSGITAKPLFISENIQVSIYPGNDEIEMFSCLLPDSWKIRGVLVTLEDTETV